MQDAIAAGAEEANIEMDVDQLLSLTDYPDITVVT